MTSEAWWFGFRVATAFFVGIGISRAFEGLETRMGWSAAKGRWILYGPCAVLLVVVWLLQ